MGDIFTWDKTAANNDDADSAINWAEGQLPSTVNNSARAMMAAVANWRDDTGGQLTSSGTNTVTLTTNSTLAAYADGQRLHFVAGGTNTGATTLNVDTRGAKAIVKFTAAGEEALQAGDITAGMHCIVQYDASLASASGAWVLINPGRGIGTLRNVTVIATATTTGTYTTPTWATALEIWLVGGGGGGGPGVTGGSVSIGAGGGGGGWGYDFILGPAASYAYAVGSGGAAGDGVNEVVGQAGNPTIINNITAGGGNGGSYVTISGGSGAMIVGGAGGSISGTRDNGGVGEHGEPVIAIPLSTGAGYFKSGNGGDSIYASGGQAHIGVMNAGAENGRAGNGYGAGGGGGFTVGSARNGGAGSDGVIFIKEYG